MAAAVADREANALIIHLLDGGMHAVVGPGKVGSVLVAELDVVECPVPDESHLLAVTETPGVLQLAVSA